MATDEQDDWESEQWEDYLLGHHFDYPEDEPWTGYPDDWRHISFQYRASVGWTCEICGIELSAHQILLHAHHLTGNRNNNEPWNLQALCLLCHSNQAGHEHMKERIAKSDVQLIQYLRQKIT